MDHTWDSGASGLPRSPWALAPLSTLPGGRVGRDAGLGGAPRLLGRSPRKCRSTVGVPSELGFVGGGRVHPRVAPARDGWARSRCDTRRFGTRVLLSFTDPARSGKEGTLSHVAQARPNGSPPPLEELYRDHMAFAWRTVRYLGVPSADAEDVVHEVFIVVGRRLGDYDPKYSARSWIGGITRNIVMHYHRKNVRSDRKIASMEA